MPIRPLFSAFLLSLTLSSPLLAAEQQPTPLVKVNDMEITNLHLAVFGAQTLGGAKEPSQAQQLALLNELVNTFMVANSPEGQAMAQNPEVAAALKVAGARLVAQALINDQLDQIEVDPAKLQTLYQQQYADSPEVELKARHILLESEQDARDVIAALGQGEDFAELAKARSTGPSGPQGGDLGWFSPDQMVGPFSEAVLGMSNQSYSQDPVKTQFGWHVILREQSRELAVPSLDEVREELEKQLKTQQLANYIRGIRDRANIEVVGDSLKVND